jgi:hypothetical protein
VFAQRFTANGASLGEFGVPTTTADHQTEPDVGMDADGDFVVTWSVRTFTAQLGLYARRYSANGAAQGGEFRLTTSPFSQRSPAVGMDADGDFLIAWDSLGQDGSDTGVYARRYATLPPLFPRPAVNAATFLHEAPPPRLRFTFSQNVSASLSAADLLVQRLGTGGGSVTVAEPTFTAGFTTATFVLGGGAGALPDGNYRATLAAAGVTNSAGEPLPSDRVVDFFVLAGDVNRDRAVNGTDFAILAGNFGKSGMTYSQGDLTGDGSVNGSDFAILAGNFGRSLPPPAASLEDAPPAAARADATRADAVRPDATDVTPAPRRRTRRR